MRMSESQAEPSGRGPAVAMPPRHPWLAVLLVAAVLLVPFCIALIGIDRSTWMKLLPAPRFERVVLEGSRANGTVIDANGGWFNGGRPTELVIRSRRTPDGWDRPQDITIRNTRIRGSIRILGMGRNGEDPLLRKSSLRPGHTRRAQDAAPRDIRISAVEIEASHRIPLYLAPGVTGVTIEHCKLTGWSVSTALYLDCESADNHILGNTFSVDAAREVIAIDGSARNRIANNRFELMSRGGIHLYRNCGEAGTIRHQTPHANLITGNDFQTASLRRGCHGIWLGSRGGRRFYCNEDAGHAFGSSADDRDFADHNTLAQNRFQPPHPRAIRDDGHGNRIDPSGGP